MIKNYFKTTLRYLWKNKFFSFINIIGLATGICVCFFALLYVHFELNHDTYNQKADDIYRLVTDVKTPSGMSYESTAAPVGPAMKAAFPEIKDVARVFMDDMILQSNPNNAMKEEVAYADSSAFKIFSWPLLRGDIKHLFNAPCDVVLSETAAKKYFGNADAMGQTMMINGNTKATVTGIMKDIPYNAHMRVDYIFSISTLVDDDWSHDWVRYGFYTYILLQPGQSMAKLQAKLPAFVKDNYDETSFKHKLFLEPLKSVYLYGKPRGHRTGTSASGSITNVYIISVIAVLVLFIACFNFINLTTAFSLQRAKEIGVRKVLGASKYQLMLQFFMDAVVLCLVSFIIALLFASLLLPLFNQLTGTIIVDGIFHHVQHVLWLLALAVVVGILSGAYPALFLSGFKPISSLKGKTGSSGTGLVLRRSLVVAQFSISIFLILATTIVYMQLNFMQNQQLGFQKDHKLVIDYQFSKSINQHTDGIKQQLMAIPGVSMVSLSSSIPGTPNNQYNSIIENGKGENQTMKTDVYFMDDVFLKQYHIDLIAGRNFQKNTALDSMKTMLINEAMLKSLGFKKPEDAIGKHFKQLNHTGEIIGVIKDFHNHSFLETVQPLTVRVDSSHLTNITIDITSADVRGTVQQLEATWKNILPNVPLVYFFADEAYNQQYIAQERFGQLFICFAIVAIVISCLGLLGLSAYNIAQRKKEISVRKVLGASVTNITLLLSADFVKLIVIALLIASPVSWLLMHNWLQSFAYRINIPVWAFISSGLAAIVIALVTISFQSIKAAVANPVKNLKAE
ncbi:ABC transporter permease [Mucilaginibacter flavus]|uniref:ABC transporter permease n=1 Tax=Mucilaginibacter flavus TaxID=931504 RepID=UPI0025B28DF5|nr:ABC transporter permease [Mucilaginibacter flavus]MDN3582170.1 ABC transporter permease [Mucilaginibacter flavus]